MPVRPSCLLLVLVAALAGEDHRFDCRLTGAWSRLHTTVDRSTKVKPDDGYDPASWRGRSTSACGDGSVMGLRLDAQGLFADRLGSDRPWWLLWGVDAGVMRQQTLAMPLVVADPEEGAGSRHGAVYEDQVGSSTLAIGPALGLAWDATTALRLELVLAMRIGVADVGFRSAQPLVGNGSSLAERTVTGRMWDWSLGLGGAWTADAWQCVAGLGWMDARTHARFIDYNAAFAGTAGSQAGIFKEDVEMRARGLVVTLGVGRRW